MDDALTTAIEAMFKSMPVTAVLITIALLMKKEIRAMLLSGKEDAEMETLMEKMVAQFEKNLEYFQLVASHTEAMRHSLTELVAVQRDVFTEVIRGNNRLGG